MKIDLGKNRKCKQCGEEPGLRIVPWGWLIGGAYVRFWNRRNKG